MSQKLHIATFVHGIDGFMVETTSDHATAAEALAYMAGFNKACDLFMASGTRRSAIITNPPEEERKQWLTPSKSN